MNLEQARFNMVEQQIRPWDVLDPEVLSLFRQIPREKFIDEQWQDLAFADVEIPLGHDQHMMFPRVEARCLQALDIEPTDICLEIGTGSGFLTACMATQAQHVDSVDCVEDFVSQAKMRLDQQGIMNISLHEADASKGWHSEEYATYDAIAVTGAVDDLSPFEALLNPSGRLFVVTGPAPVMTAYKISRNQDSTITREALFETALKPLIGCEAKAAFEF